MVKTIFISDPDTFEIDEKGLYHRSSANTIRLLISKEDLKEFAEWIIDEYEKLER